MGRREREDLCITVPSFFKCPISLDVMKSPVSLCTGVTYDRASIQEWLDGGNNTCPATMQILPSKDFVPNHNLHRLIQIWSSSNSASRLRLNALTNSEVLELIEQISNPAPEKENQFERLLKILCFASESTENRKFLAQNDRFILILIQKLTSFLQTNVDSVDAAVKILQLIVKSHGNKAKLRSLFFSADPLPLPAMAQILKHGRPDSRVAVANIIEAIASDTESKIAVIDSDDLLSGLLGCINNTDPEPESTPTTDTTTDSLLSCLIALSTPKRNKYKIVRAGLVKQLGRLLSSTRSVYNAELAFKLLEMVAGCGEGRMAISDDPNCIPRAVMKLLKVSNMANEHAVALLWSMCYLFRDQRAKEAVMKWNGLTKILLVMQSNCSPAVKQMCGDLLRIFRVNSKSCLSSYDTKTTHIMPF